MKKFENPFRYSARVRTVSQLMEQLQINPPDVFQGRMLMIADNRDVTTEDAQRPNLFTFAALSDHINFWLAQSLYGEKKLSYSLDTGESLHFGSLYRTRVETVEENGEVRAKRIVYDSQQRKVFLGSNNFFRPTETLILGGEDHVDKPLLIEMTRYKNRNEEVDVYKITSGKDDAARSIIIVGRPTWDARTQRRIAQSLGMRPGSV